jgi:hypothetical protein
MKDAISATIELAALICPIMPTCNPKVSPISISKRDRRVDGRPIEKRDMNRDGIKNFPILS